MVVHLYRQVTSTCMYGVVINHMEFCKQPYRMFGCTTIDNDRSSNSLRVGNLDNGGVIVPAPADTVSVDIRDHPGHSTECTA